MSVYRREGVGMGGEGTIRMVCRVSGVLGELGKNKAMDKEGWIQWNIGEIPPVRDRLHPIFDDL